MNARGYITDFFLLFLILLNLLDFLTFLPGDVDFVKKIISWTILALLFYKVHFTWLFWGKKRAEKSGFFPNHFFDLAILLSYLVLSAKSVVVVAQHLGEEALFFNELLRSITQYSAEIQIFSFYIGGGLLILMSLGLSLLNIREKSLLGNFHVHKVPKLFRFPLIFLLLSSFYLLVFDLLLEWLGIAVDSLLIVLGLLLYIYIIARRHKHFSAHTLIHRVGSFGESFEEKFIAFFHDKQHLFLGITGLFVLHLLTEIANFLLPYLNINNSFYFTTLGLQPVFTQLFLDMQAAHPATVVVGYVLNVVGLLLLAVLPAFIWAEVYKKKVKALYHWLTGMAFAAFPVFVLAPLFSFASLHESFVGVNILTRSMLVPYLYWIVWGSVVLGGAMYGLSFISFMRKAQYHVIVLATLVFLFYYMWLFYTSTVSYFNETLQFLLQEGWYFLLFFIALFFVIKVLFYVFGSIKFLIQILRNHLL